MLGNLLIKPHAAQSTEAFVEALPSLIGCDKWVAHTTATQARYYTCHILGSEITLSRADLDEFKGYTLRICFEPDNNSILDQSFLNLAADTVARKLTAASYEVLRPLDLRRIGTGAILYYLNPDPKAEGFEKILTREI